MVTIFWLFFKKGTWLEVVVLGENYDPIWLTDFYQTGWLEGVGDMTYPFLTASCITGGGCEIYYKVDCLSTNEGVWHARNGVVFSYRWQPQGAAAGLYYCHLQLVNGQSMQGTVVLK